MVGAFAVVESSSAFADPPEALIWTLTTSEEGREALKGADSIAFDSSNPTHPSIVFSNPELAIIGRIYFDGRFELIAGSGKLDRARQKLDVAVLAASDLARGAARQTQLWYPSGVQVSNEGLIAFREQVPGLSGSRIRFVSAGHIWSPFDHRMTGLSVQRNSSIANRSIDVAHFAFTQSGELLVVGHTAEPYAQPSTLLNTDGSTYRVYESVPGVWLVGANSETADWRAVEIIGGGRYLSAAVPPNGRIPASELRLVSPTGLARVPDGFLLVDGDSLIECSTTRRDCTIVDRKHAFQNANVAISVDRSDLFFANTRYGVFAFRGKSRGYELALATTSDAPDAHPAVDSTFRAVTEPAFANGANCLNLRSNPLPVPGGGFFILAEGPAEFRFERGNSADLRQWSDIQLVRSDSSLVETGSTQLRFVGPAESDEQLSQLIGSVVHDISNRNTVNRDRVRDQAQRLLGLKASADSPMPGSETVVSPAVNVLRLDMFESALQSFLDLYIGTPIEIGTPVESGSSSDLEAVAKRPLTDEQRQSTTNLASDLEDLAQPSRKRRRETLASNDVEMDDSPFQATRSFAALAPSDER